MYTTDIFGCNYPTNDLYGPIIASLKSTSNTYVVLWCRCSLKCTFKHIKSGSPPIVVKEDLNHCIAKLATNLLCSIIVNRQLKRSLGNIWKSNYKLLWFHLAWVMRKGANDAFRTNAFHWILPTDHYRNRRKYQLIKIDYATKH